MKKTYLIGFFLILCVLKSNNCLSQDIKAGIVSSLASYYDIVPDTSLEEYNVHLSQFPGENYSIDINNDGAIDFRISTWGGGGLGGGTGGCTISTIGIYSSVVAHSDTSIGCCPSQYIANLADTLNFGDTISNGDNFITGSIYLWSESYGMASAPIISDWLNIGEHYIGIRLMYPTDTLFRWIRVEATGNGLKIIKIKDYACNKNLNSIPILNNLDKLQLYPNPTSGKFIIAIPLFIEQSTVFIYSINGIELLKVPMNKGKAEIDISNLNNGIYFAKIINEKTVKIKLFLKE